MSTSQETIAQQYFQAWTTGDYARARSYLADDGFSFDGPLEQHDDADRFIESFKQLGPATQAVELRTVISDGPEVATVYDFLYRLPDGSTGNTKTSEWLRIEGDRITRIRIFFDPRPYTAQFG